MDAKTWKRGNLNIKRGMKPRVEGRVACIKMRVRLQPLQRYNYFLNHQTKNRKKSLMDAKIWETIQKGPKMHHKGD